MTHREKQVLEYIVAFMREHQYAPSVSEIAEGVGCTFHMAKYALMALQRDGYIEFYGNRQITVLYKQ